MPLRCRCSGRGGPGGGRQHWLEDPARLGLLTTNDRGDVTPHREDPVRSRWEVVADQAVEALKLVVQVEQELRVKVLLAPALFMRLEEVEVAKVPQALTQMAAPDMLG